MSRAANIFGHAGNCASVACAIHCIALPLLISILPAAGLTWFATGWVELTMLVAAILFSLMSLCWGYTVHRRFRVFAFVAAAVCWFYIAHDDPQHHLFYSLVGGGCLIAANVYNRILCRSCHVCCNH